MFHYTNPESTKWGLNIRNSDGQSKLVESQDPRNITKKGDTGLYIYLFIWF